MEGKHYWENRVLLLLSIVIIGGSVMGQGEELWFGTYTDENYRIHQGRYEIVTHGTAMKSLKLAPYGKPSAEFKIIENDTIDHFVKLLWPGDLKIECLVIRYNEGYYSGNCVKGTKVMPLTIKRFNFQTVRFKEIGFL